MVRRQLGVARCEPTAVLDLVEEPFDHVAFGVEIRAGADRLFASAQWQSGTPRGLFGSTGLVASYS